MTEDEQFQQALREADEVSMDDLVAASDKLYELEMAHEYEQVTDYEQLTDYQRGAYDYVSQRGGDHDECMDAARSL